MRERVVSEEIVKKEKATRPARTVVSCQEEEVNGDARSVCPVLWSCYAFACAFACALYEATCALSSSCRARRGSRDRREDRKMTLVGSVDRGPCHEASVVDISLLRGMSEG